MWQSRVRAGGGVSVSSSPFAGWRLRWGGAACLVSGWRRNWLRVADGGTYLWLFSTSQTGCPATLPRGGTCWARPWVRSRAARTTCATGCAQSCRLASSGSVQLNQLCMKRVRAGATHLDLAPPPMGAGLDDVPQMQTARPPPLALAPAWGLTLSTSPRSPSFPCTDSSVDAASFFP